jgi:hypothetical protein
MWDHSGDDRLRLLEPIWLQTKRDALPTIALHQTSTQFCARLAARIRVPTALSIGDEVESGKEPPCPIRDILYCSLDECVVNYASDLQVSSPERSHASPGRKLAEPPAQAIDTCSELV